MNVLQSTYDELKAERDALAIKAARYDLLRISADISWNGWVTHSMLAATDADREALDAAIDAARSGGGGSVVKFSDTDGWDYEIHQDPIP